MDPQLAAKIQAIEALSPRKGIQVFDPEVLLASGPFIVEYQGIATAGAGLVFNPDDGSLLWTNDYQVARRNAADVRILGNSLQIGTGDVKTVIRPFAPEDVVILLDAPPDFGGMLDELFLVLTGVEV